jgi:hypothetical protein
VERPLLEKKTLNNLILFLGRHVVPDILIPPRIFILPTNLWGGGVLPPPVLGVNEMTVVEIRNKEREGPA